MPTAWGYMRLSLADQRKPDRAAADRAAVVDAQAAYLARGYSAGEIVTDEPDQLKRAVAARPGGYRVGRQAKPGDVILTPTAGRLARSVAELHDTLKRWHGAGVVGVVLDLRLDFGTPEGRAALALMEAGAHLDRSINRLEKTDGMTADERLSVNRWGLQQTPGRRAGAVEPAELVLMARCAAWHAAGATFVRIALQLNHEAVPLPARMRKRNRSRFRRGHVWRWSQVRTMIESYHVVAGLFARGAVSAPPGFTMPSADPTPIT